MNFLLHHRSMRFPSIALLFALTCATPAATSREGESELVDRLRELTQEARIPGLAVAVLVDGEVVGSEALGWADIEAQRAMATTSVMNVGSVSKLVTSTAVLQLWERGDLDLDVDVTDYLPFEFRHPAGGVPITPRHLLTHTSGIQDGPAYGASYACGDPAVSLADWLEGYLVEGGEYYSPKNFLTGPPGTVFEYSNVGYGLLGLIAERVSGLAFAELTRERIFEPLAMTSTGWRLDAIDLDRHATPYWVPSPDAEPDPEELALLARAPGPVGEPIPFCLYSFYNYPDGLLRTTIEDLARFVAATQPGESAAEPLLSEATRSEVFRNQMESIATDGRVQGLGWRSNEVGDLGTLWGHGGADPGIRAHVLHRPADGVTILAMTNTLVVEAFRPILEVLFEEGARVVASEDGH